MIPLVFIVGSTAVGKTKWAIEWAEQQASCILNSDSIQVYKDLNIGSAKPDFKKYPHLKFYLFNQILAPEVWTAGKFRKQALNILNRKINKKTILIVGGSGFYIQALEKGMYPTQTVSRKITQKLEKILKTKGLDHLYKDLKKRDPKTAQKISCKDQYRIFRSLSLIESEGKTLSQIKKEFMEQKLPWPYLKIGLKTSKEKLLQRVKKRTNKMLKQGLIEEIEILVKKGFRHWKPLSRIGYREGLLYLEGKIKKENLADKIISSTMALAKKQNTWFKKDKNIKWVDTHQSALTIYKEIFK